ncbi:MAG: flagellar basal body rod protein FlgB [Candidatus Methylomirabilales bacterium]
MSVVFDPTSHLLGEMVRVTAQRHRVLAANLANVETPDYRAQEASFAVALDEARGGARVELSVGPDADAVPRRDGNSVDLDRQMVKLAQNTGWHLGVLQILANRLGLMRTVITSR